ncbi:hypothetical protein [[Phormidium ambiguum] IAM M-71]|nr:hypothetical protein [Phormidium ambiguum]
MIVTTSVPAEQRVILKLDIIPRFICQSLIDGETATLKAFCAWVREQQ